MVRKGRRQFRLDSMIKGILRLLKAHCQKFHAQKSGIIVDTKDLGTYLRTAQKCIPAKLGELEAVLTRSNLHKVYGQMVGFLSCLTGHRTDVESVSTAQKGVMGERLIRDLDRKEVIRQAKKLANLWELHNSKHEIPLVSKIDVNLRYPSEPEAIGQI